MKAPQVALRGSAGERFGWGRLPGLSRVLTGVGVVMLALPSLIVLVASLTEGDNIIFPPRGITLSWYGDLFTDASIWRAMQHSLYVATLSTAINAVAGVAAALALSRSRSRISSAIRVVFSLGIMTPIIVSAMAFLTLFLQWHLVGSLTTVGLAISVVTFPFMLWTVSSALEDRDPSLTDAAATLGADPVEQFLFVTLPLVAAGVFTGCLMVFLLSITDFVISIVLTDVDTATLPVVIYSGLRSNVSPLLGAATVLFVGIAIVVSAIALRLGRLERFVFRR